MKRLGIAALWVILIALCLAGVAFGQAKQQGQQDEAPVNAKRAASTASRGPRASWLIEIASFARCDTRVT